MPSRNSAVLVLLILSLVSACGGGEPDVYADGIEKVSETDAQSAPILGRLSVPLAVIVRSSEGQIMPRVRVRWRAGAPGVGQLSDSITVSDAHGRAQADFILGSTLGAQTVRAELAINRERSVVFSVTGTEPPVLTSVSPPSFTGGDTVTVQGTGLDPAAVFEVNAQPAEVVSGTVTSLSVVIPVCLPNDAVTLRARVKGSPSNTLPGTYVAAPASTPLRLAVGDYAAIDPGQLDGCATFPAAGAEGAEYLIAPQGVTGTPGVSAAYRLLGDSVVEMTVMPMAEAEPRSAAAAFHDFVRRREIETSRTPRPAGPAGAPAAAAAEPIRLGDERDYRVCSKIECSLLGDFAQVRARARYVGDHVAIFQDVTAPANGFTDGELQSLGQMFNNVLYDVATRNFGVESDIDADGVVSILLTPVVNRLTPREQCNVSLVTGFFFSIDLDPAFTADLRANPGEVFYSMVPDPDGAASCVIPKDRAQAIIPATFIHEFQHMISYNQHVLIRRRPGEQLWLNEALSHLAEELAGVAFREAGQQQVFSDFVFGNVYNAFQYLKAPGTHTTVFGDGSGTLPERGASWLFLRWMVDKFGGDLPRRLSETQLVGAENITAATGEPAGRLLSQWFMANYVSDLPGFSAPPRLRYDTWSFRTAYASLHQQLPARFERPFPLEPAVHEGGDFAATGTLSAGSGDYFLVTQAGGQRGFTLRLTDPDGAALTGAVAPRLNVVRIK